MNMVFVGIIIILGTAFLVFSPPFKMLAKYLLKILKLYDPVSKMVRRARFFLHKYRIMLKSRFAKFECQYTNFQIDPNKKKVCIIIPCYNHLEYTKEAIDSYYAAIDNCYNYILVVMDDHSTDQTKAFLSEKARGAKNICYFRYKKNIGLTQLWNDGILFALRKIKADYIFITNNDILIPKGTFNKLLIHLLNYKNIGAIGPLTNSPGYSPVQDIRKFIPTYAASDLKADIQATAELIKENKPVELGHINGFFMGFTKEALEGNVHSRFLSKPFYFDPLNKNINNENEFLLRLKQSGFKIVMATDAFVFHYKDVTLKRFSNGQIAFYRRNEDLSKPKSF